MPTVLEIEGYKFKFYSNENNEQVHVHVRKGSGNMKIWLLPTVIEEYSYNFTVRAQRDIRNIVLRNLDKLIKDWYAYFS